MTEVHGDKVILKDGTVHNDFDYLILSTGSSYNLKFIQITKLDKVVSPYIVDCTSSKSLITSSKKILLAHDILIIGAGAVGIEVATELIHKYPSKKFTIIASGKILERCCKDAHKYCLKFLSKYSNVKLRTGEKVKEVIGNEVITTEGYKIKTDLIYYAIGFQPNTSIIKIPDSLEKKFIKVNESLQVNRYRNIFCGGDIANILEEKLAQNAGKFNLYFLKF